MQAERNPRKEENTKARKTAHPWERRSDSVLFKMDILGVSADSSQPGCFSSTTEERNTQEGQKARPRIHAVPLGLKVICHMETTVISHIPHDAMLCFVAMVTANLSVFCFFVPSNLVPMVVGFGKAFPALALCRRNKTSHQSGNPSERTKLMLK